MSPASRAGSLVLNRSIFTKSILNNFNVLYPTINYNHQYKFIQNQMFPHSQYRYFSSPNSTETPQTQTQTQKQISTDKQTIEGSNGSGKDNKDTKSKDLVKPTLWVKIKHEANHYWAGTKLLGLEIKISSKLLLKSTAGYELSRRESRQLERTITDIIRLVPFSVFVLVPFAELLLPIALKIFPGLLPSTFESSKSKEQNRKKLRNTRKTVSDVLRKTIQETGMSLPSAITANEKEDFQEFFKQVRQSGVSPSRDLVLRVARLFKDDVVLDNLSRPQLVAMAKYINIKPFGTDLLLRYLIRNRLLQIRKDDRAIDYEGVKSLSTIELQHACASRSIKPHSSSPAGLREDLQLWLDLRLREKVPSTLLVLSSAYTYGEVDIESLYGALEAVLSALPEELYHEAELSVVDQEATNEQRINLIREQEELIKDEIEQEKESGSVLGVKDDKSIDQDEENIQNEESKNKATTNNPKF